MYGRREFTETSLAVGIFLLLLSIIAPAICDTAEGAVVKSDANQGTGELTAVVADNRTASESMTVASTVADGAPMEWRAPAYTIRNPEHPAIARARTEGWDCWIRNISDELAVTEHGCWFDEEAGLRAVAFIERNLVYLEDTQFTRAGEPMELMDWQYYDLVMPLMGWMREDGTRRFRTAYIEVPKKNTKSTICGALALYFEVADGERRAQVYLAACDREQAGIIFSICEEMVKESPTLRDEIEPVTSQKRLVHWASGSVLKALSREYRSKEGLNIHALIFDELHAQPDSRLWNTFRYGGRARRQPMIIAITTAGERKQGICWEQHELSRQVLDGSVDLMSHFAYIRGIDPEDDWKDERVWYKANPSLGKIFSVENMRDEYQEAVASPAAELRFRRYNLNEWIEGGTRWMDMAAWDACEGRFTLEELEGCRSAAGLDLATRDDMVACVLAFRLEHDGKKRIALVPYFWCPTETATTRHHKDDVPYLTWAERGYIELTPGARNDFDVIEEKIMAQRARFDFERIGLDNWQAAQMEVHFQDAGLEPIEYRQGWKLSPYVKQLEALVREGVILHDGNPVLRWMVSNATVDVSADLAVRLNRRDSADKIDGVVAAAQAVAVLDMYQDDAYVYEPGSLRMDDEG